MSRFLNPQWLQCWHFSKVQQKPHSLIISLAVRTESALVRMSKCALGGENLNFLPFLRIKFHYKFFLLSSFISCFPEVLAKFPNAFHEWAMQTSHQPLSSLPSLIMALIPSRWINIFIPSAFKARRLLQSPIQEWETVREKEMKSWKRSTGKDDRWKGGSMSKWTNSKVTKLWQDFPVLPIIRLIYFPLDTIITVVLIIFPS